MAVPNSSRVYLGQFTRISSLGFKYIALGDVLILLTFGPITVVYAYMAQAGQYSIYPVLYALPLTLNTEAILHSNNTRDMQHDKSVGILTLSIILGKRFSYYFYCLLIYSPYVIISYMTVAISWYCFLPLLTISYAYRLCEEFKHDQLSKLPNRTAILNLILGVLYVCSIFLTNVRRQEQPFFFSWSFLLLWTTLVFSLFLLLFICRQWSAYCFWRTMRFLLQICSDSFLKSKESFSMIFHVGKCCW